MLTDAPRHVAGLGLLVAAVATVGSLYLSLGLGLVPCEFCWYQRICMYPLVAVYAAGVFTGDYRQTVVTAIPLVTVGSGIAAYHSYIQIAAESGCTTGGCAAVLFRVGGVFSIPNLSLIAFLLVGAATLAIHATTGK